MEVEDRKVGNTQRRMDNEQLDSKLVERRIAGFVLTTGEPTTNIAYQSMCDLNIPCMLVSNIKPFNKAINFGMNSLKDYEYVLKSDADIFIKKDALAKMLKLMSKNVGMVAGIVVYNKKSLLGGQSGHVKLFNMKAWREVGEYLYELASERQWVKRMKAKGWHIAYCNDACGLDIKSYGVMEIIKKFHRLAIKERITSKQKQNYLRYCLQKLVHRTKYVGKHHNLGSILAFFGTFLGLAKLPLFTHQEWGMATRRITTI